MAIKRRDFQKIAAVMHEFLLKLDEDADCCEVRDALNYALLQLQRYFRALRNRSHQSLGADGDHTGGSNILGQSVRGMSPMTPFRDAPDRFVWRWVDLESVATNGRAGVTLPANLDREEVAVPSIMRAARNSDNHVLVQLIERDPDAVHEVDCLGRTAIFYAVHFACLDTLQLLLEQGADVNAVTTDGSTAVHRACCNGNHEALRILIQYHADVTVQDVHGRAPIHWAAITDSCECLRMLLEAKVDAGVRDSEGLSPSMWACRWDRIEHFDLLSAYEQKRPKPRTQKRRDSLQNVDENGYERDISGRTWMHWSVRRTEPLECLKTLLTEESAWLRDSSDKTVLHVAAEQGSLNAVKTVLEIAGKECLEQRDKDNRTPLMLATIGGHGEVVNCLLAEGADMTAVDNFGATAWSYAMARQLHYCLLIIASYLRQRNKNQPNAAGTSENGVGDAVFGTMDSNFGLDSLQINGGGHGDGMAGYFGSTPHPPEKPPVTPRTPRTSRQTTSRLAQTVPPNFAVQTGSPPTPRGHPQKRSPPAAMYDGEDVAGYEADQETRGQRPGSSSKRMRSADNTEGFRRRSRSPPPAQNHAAPRDSGRRHAANNHSPPSPGNHYSNGGEEDDAGIDDAEPGVSIDVMDVSDFDENDVDNDDMDVPPSPRPPHTPRGEQRPRSRAGYRESPQSPQLLVQRQTSPPNLHSRQSVTPPPQHHEPRQSPTSSPQHHEPRHAPQPAARRPPSRPSSRNQTPPAIEHQQNRDGQVMYINEVHHTHVDDSNDDGWITSEAVEILPPEPDTHRDRQSSASSSRPPLPKSPPPSSRSNDDRQAVLPIPPSHLMPLAPTSTAVRKKKKRRSPARGYAAPIIPPGPQHPQLYNSSLDYSPDVPATPRSRSQPPVMEMNGMGPGGDYHQQRPVSRGNRVDQWIRDEQPIENEDSDELVVHNVDRDTQRSGPNHGRHSPSAGNGGQKYSSGTAFNNGPVNHTPTREISRKSAVNHQQQQSLKNGNAFGSTAPLPRDVTQRPPISPRRSVTTGQPASDVPWARKSPAPLANGDLRITSSQLQRRH